MDLEIARRQTVEVGLDFVGAETARQDAQGFLLQQLALHLFGVDEIGASL